MKKYLKSKGVLAVLLSGALLSGVGLVGCGGGGGGADGGAGGAGEGSGGGSGGNGGSNVMSAESALTAAYHSVFLSYLGVSAVPTGDGLCGGGGTISVSREGNTLTITYNNCKTRQYYEEGMVVGYEWLWNGTIKASIRSIEGCPMSMPTRVEILNLRMVIREGRGNDGTWDTDLEYNISNLVKTHSYTLGSGCEINSVKVNYSTQGNGSISVTDRVKGDNFTIRNLSMTATLTSTSSSDKESFSGTMTVTSSCYTASLNIQTLEDLITPNSEDCPTSGKIRITGGTNATYIFTSTGGIQIDLGNNGTIDKTYNKCSDISSPICKQ